MMMIDRILDNLKNDNYKIDFLQKKPFVIFKIQDFLSDEEYYLFKDAFQDLKKFTNIKEKLIKNKFSYNSSEEIYKKIILENQSAHKIHQTVFNKNFINFFFKKLFFNYFQARIDNPFYILKLLRPKIKNYELKKHNIFEKIFFSKITPQIEYSYMLNNARIDPHTDFEGKLLSLMLYFPDEDLKDSVKSNLGTTFYKNNLSSTDSKHLDDLKNRNKFYHNAEKIYQLPFEKKILYGFVRTKKSWHTVEKFNLHNNFVRKSMNINLFL